MYVFKKKIYKVLVPLFDVVGYILFWFRNLVKKETKPAEPKNILVIRLDHIGDVLFATPAVKILRERFKGSKITFLVGSWAKGVLEKNPNINQIIVYDAPWFKRDKEQKSAGFWQMVKKVKEQNFDLGIDLRGDLRNIALMYLGGVKYRVGYGITGGGFLLSKVVKYDKAKHEIRHNIDILEQVAPGVSHGRIAKPEFFTLKEDENFASEFLFEHGIINGDAIIAIHPGAGSQVKLWDENKFAEVISSLSKKAKIIVFGNEKEKDLVRRIIALSKADCVNAAGKTTLGQMAAIIKKCKVFIGTDSGPAHIASAVGTPVISIFSGVNDPAQWGPVGDKVIILNMESTQPKDVLECVSV